MPGAQARLAGFLAKSPPEVRRTAKAALAAMRRHMPGASGNQVRHIRLVPDVSVLDEPAVRALIAQAIATSDVPLNPKQRRKMVIRSVSTKQRPRRPRSK